MVGEYRIDGKLGQGAFGTVYRAVHPLIGKVVAIKVLARKFSVDPEMVSRFVAEARAVNQIRHRNIIDIFSFGALEDGRQYYVMEYLEGEPLDVLIDRAGKLPLAEALPILRGIGKALDAAHAKGVAHRDLKAENVFIASDPDGGVWPKLLDFGIAKLLAPEESQKHKTRTGISVGTPYYMSPEQCRGKDVDHRTDIYAFGVLCYRVLTGVYPFDGDDHISIMMQQVNADPAPPSTYDSDLAPLDDIVLWLLAKEPSDRPADLRTAVKALAGETDVDTQPPNRAVPMQTNLAVASVPVTARKSRGPLIAGLLVALLGVGAGIFFVVNQRKHDQAAPSTPSTELVPAPAPVPVTPPAPVPAPAPIVEPELAKAVIVTVAGVPEGTEVLVGAEVIGAAPGPVQLARGDAPIVLTFRADGHVTASHTVVPDADKPLDVTLKKKPRRGGGNKPTRDDIIDVFGGKK
ncbi:MAG TPA: serine/threonine-protein kinase [Kofleriaceae bacterium]